MTMLDDFLAEQSKSFDVSKIFSAEIEDIDTTIPPAFVYKYYSTARASFFSNPSFRFSPRSALNDPFEFRSRWTEFASQVVRNAYSEHLKKAFRNLGKNKELFLQMTKNEAVKQGIFLDDNQLRQARERLQTKAGREGIRQFIDNGITQIDAFIELACAHATLGMNESLEKFAASYGVFSISEVPTNEQLWGLYAESGKGFCIELNTNEQFFRAPNGRSLLWKVKYTDETLEGFMTNPFYLFLVKNQNWAFEREWRTIRQLSDCDEIVGPDHDIHLIYPRPGLIRAVLFGYQYDKDQLAYDGAQLLSFDPNIQIRKAYVDLKSRRIAFHDLTPK